MEVGAQVRRGGPGVLLAALAAVLSCGLLWPATSLGSSFTVTTTTDELNTDGDCSLREAVQAANTTGSVDNCTATNTDLDIINLPAAGYTLTLDGVDDTNAAGDLDILNEGLSIVGQATTGPSTIDGGTSDGDSVDDRVIDFHPSAANGAFEDLGLTGLVITGGTTTGAGGGIRINGPPAAAETIVANLSLLTVTGNTATSPGGATPGHGGGIENQGGEDVDISESTISGNSAASQGGGVDTFAPGADPASTQFGNVTVSNNTADSDADNIGNGGGVAGRLTGSGTFYNTILAGNFDASPTGTVAPDCTLDSFSGGYNLVGNTSNCLWVAGTGDLLNVPAGLAPLAPIPGAGVSTVLAHDLLPGSLAREAGHPGAPGSAAPFTCGLEAQNFGPRPQGPRCDIGSVEADYIPPSPPPTGTPPGNPASPINPAGNVRKRKCKKKKRSAGGATVAAKKKCKKKRR